MFVAQALFHHKITVWGGDQRRALLHVDDMASCYLDLLAADAEAVAGKWNVDCANMTVMEIAEAVKKRTGADIEVQPIPPEPLPGQIPIDRQTVIAFPRVRASVAFVRRPSYRGHRSHQAGIRNPSRFDSFDP